MNESSCKHILISIIHIHVQGYTMCVCVCSDMLGKGKKYVHEKKRRNTIELLSKYIYESDGPRVIT